VSVCSLAIVQVYRHCSAKDLLNFCTVSLGLGILLAGYCVNAMQCFDTVDWVI